MGCQFYLLKESVFSFIDLCYCFLHVFFIYFFTISVLLTLGFLIYFFCCFFSSFSICFRCKVWSFMMFFSFLEVGLYCYKLPSFAVSHRFWVVMFSLSFVNFLFDASVTCWLFRSRSFSLHVFVFFSFFSPCNSYLVS